MNYHAFFLKSERNNIIDQTTRTGTTKVSTCSFLDATELISSTTVTGDAAVKEALDCVIPEQKKHNFNYSKVNLNTKNTASTKRVKEIYYNPSAIGFRVSIRTNEKIDGAC